MQSYPLHRVIINNDNGVFLISSENGNFDSVWVQPIKSKERALLSIHHRDSQSNGVNPVLRQLVVLRGQGDALLDKRHICVGESNPELEFLCGLKDRLHLALQGKPSATEYLKDREDRPVP